MRLGPAAIALLAVAACGRPQDPTAPAPSSPAPTAPFAPAPAGADAARAPAYVALGDSFTAGTGATAAQAFPARLVGRWDARGCRARLVNLGVNGYTTDDLLAEELPEVRGHGPSLVTVAIGANDIVAGRSLAEYKLRLGRIFEGIAAAGVAPARVVALPQPDWSAAPAAASFGDPGAIRASIVSFNDALRDEARRRGARYVDLWPVMQRQAAAGMVAPDGLHPSAAAYDEWADELFRTPVSPCGE
jgi:lysophospholipase L1-like esterase